MRRAAIFPLFGPALVLYLLADVAASPGALDTFAYVVGAVAVLLSSSLLRRGSDSEDRGAIRVGWLGFSAAVALLRAVPTDLSDLPIEEVCAVALCGVGALVLDLALNTPDSIVPPRLRVVARIAPYLLGSIAALLSAVAIGPAFAPWGSPWLISAKLTNSSTWFIAFALAAALGLRLARRRLGSSPEALASNGWALLGLLPAVFALSFGAFTALAPAVFVGLSARAFFTLAALGLYFGHLWLIDPRRRLYASSAIRELIAAAISGGLLAVAVVPLRALQPASSLGLGLWVVATFLLGLLIFQALQPVLHGVLSPFQGRLLRELQAFSRAAEGVHGLSDLGRIELGAMRRASGSTRAVPLLYAFDPAFELHIDAAGETHRSERQLHPAILEQLRSRPGEIILRAPLETQIVRQPKLRPLVQALTELDVLCVLPLVSDGELEGALCVPRGERRAPLSLEELTALDEHARTLTAFFALFCAQARTLARSSHLIVSHERAEARVERLEDENARVLADLELLHAGAAVRAESRELFAYSPAMRTLLDKLRSLSALDVPVLVRAERGLPVVPVACFLHEQSARAAQPFIVVSCASLREDESAALLFGGMHNGVRHPGALRVAGAGSVLITDIAALGREAQHTLALTLSSRSVRTVDGAETYALDARIVVSTETDLSVLAASAKTELGSADPKPVFDDTLAERLAPAAVELPPLRDRPEDIASYALLAIDRACRRLGRSTLGLEPAALDALRAHTFPGNIDELTRVIEHAVGISRGERIRVSDLPLGEQALALQPSVLDGSLEEIERRALEHALSRSLGNKSEAARLLGLPRTTFLDKLRKHKLDDGTRDNPSSPPN